MTAPGTWVGCAARREPARARARDGASLPAPLRRDLEPAFHHDFADVRIHTDARAARDTRRLGARAFTVGREISFAPGAYAPSTPRGRRLLAHELAHVVQQAGAVPVAEPPVGAAAEAPEREADAVADRVAAGGTVGAISVGRTPVVRRQVDDDAPEPVASPAQAQGWSPSLPWVFSIHVDSSKAQPGGALGSASSAGLVPFSAQGRVEHFCSTPADYPLRFRFYVDAAGMARPQPFRPPSVGVAADFTPSGGSARRVVQLADPAPAYVGPGWPLAPAFGEQVVASSSGSGVLAVQATLRDPDTATAVVYRDSVVCELVPCA